MFSQFMFILQFVRASDERVWAFFSPLYYVRIHQFAFAMFFFVFFVSHEKWNTIEFICFESVSDPCINKQWDVLSFYSQIIFFPNLNLSFFVSISFSIFSLILDARLFILFIYSFLDYFFVVVGRRRKIFETIVWPTWEYIHYTLCTVPCWPRRKKIIYDSVRNEKCNPTATFFTVHWSKYVENVKWIRKREEKKFTFEIGERVKAFIG